MPCDTGRNADEAGRAVASDGRPRRRLDGPPPRSLLRPEPLEPSRDGRRAGRTVRRRRRGRDRRQRLQRAGRPADRAAGRRDQDRRQRRRPVRPGSAASSRPRRRRIAGRASRSSPTARTGPARSSSCGCSVDDGVDLGSRRPEPRGQGRRPGLSPRAAVERGVRRVRPVVPLGRPAERHRPAPRVDGRGRPRRPDRASEWTPPGAATTACSAASRAWPGCSTGSAASLDAVGIGAAVRQRLFVTNPARAVLVRVADRRCQRMTEELRTSVVGSHARPVLVRGRDRGGRARRVRAGRPGRDARRRGRPRAPRPGGGRHRHRHATARCAAPASSPPSSTAT